MLPVTWPTSGACAWVVGMSLLHQQQQLERRDAGAQPV